MIREGLRFLCSRQPDLELVGEAANGLEALEVYEQLRPDVVIMDLDMPVMDGIKATAELLARHPGARVLALSMHADPCYVALMREAGALGYMLKEEASESLASAVRSVLAGKTAFPA